MSPQSKILVITGMHRSGTSMVSSYLSSVGVDLGTKLLVKDMHNPQGYFEDTDILEFQRSLAIESCKGGKDGWPDWGYTEDHVWNAQVAKDSLKQAKGLIKKKGFQRRYLCLEGTAFSVISGYVGRGTP